MANSISDFCIDQPKKIVLLSLITSMKKITAIRSASKQKKQQKLLLDVAMHNIYVHTCLDTSTHNSPLSPNITNHKSCFYSTRSTHKTVIPQHQTQKKTANKDAQNTQDLSLDLPCKNERKIDYIPTPNYTTSKAIFKRCYSITRKQMGSASGLYANNTHFTQLTSSDYLFLMRNRRASIAASQIESIRLTNASECKFAFNKLLYSIFKNKETNSTWKGSLRVIANDNAHVTHKETSTKQCRLFAV